MRILMIASHFPIEPFGGAERVTRVIAEGMVRRGHEVVVATTEGTPCAANTGSVAVRVLPLRNLYPLSAETRHTPAARGVWHALDSANPLMVSPLAATIEDVKPDVVHSHNITGFSPVVWPVVRRAGVPVLHTLHDYYTICARSSMIRGGRPCQSRHVACRLAKIPAIHWSSQVNRVVGVSKFVLDRHREVGAFRGVDSEVIGNPLPFELPPSSTSRPDVPLRLGMLGRVEPAKGIEVLLSALALIPNANCTLRVGGLGNPDYLEDLQRRFPDNRVSYLGAVHAPEFYKNIDALVAPSLWNETFGMSIVEAQAFEIPALASKRGAFPDVVVPEETGFLFEPLNPASLATVLTRCIANPRILAEMGPACRASAARFEADRILDRYEDTYRAVVEA